MEKTHTYFTEYKQSSYFCVFNCLTSLLLVHVLHENSNKIIQQEIGIFYSINKWW